MLRGSEKAASQKRIVLAVERRLRQQAEFFGKLGERFTRAAISSSQATRLTASWLP